PLPTPRGTRPGSIRGMTSYDGISSGGSRRNGAILITGAGGEVGHGLIRALYERGRRDIVAIDIRELDAGIRAMCMQTYVGDICDPMLLGRLMAMYELYEDHYLAA